MKRITLTLLIAIVALTSINAYGKRSRASSGSIPFDKLVRMIATEAQVKEKNLSNMGLKKLAKDSHKEEHFTCVMYIYGKNANATISKNWHVKLTATGAHAFAVEVALTSDHSYSIYFKEKADHDTFITHARQSRYYKKEYGEERIGNVRIESDEYYDGWYVISFY